MIIKLCVTDQITHVVLTCNKYYSEYKYYVLINAMNTGFVLPLTISDTQK